MKVRRILKACMIAQGNLLGLGFEKYCEVWYSLLKVRGHYADLNGLMTSLSERVSLQSLYTLLLDNRVLKLNHVACTQEKEFLSAYRVHMLSVQLELKELKEKYAIYSHWISQCIN